MISKDAIDFSNESEVSSFGSDPSILNQDPDEENKSNSFITYEITFKVDILEEDSKMIEEESSNQLPENQLDSKNQVEDFQTHEPKPVGRRKGGVQKAGENLRGAAKAKKAKLVASKKEQGLSKERIFLYKPFVPLPDLSEFVNTPIEVNN